MVACNNVLHEGVFVVVIIIILQVFFVCFIPLKLHLYITRYEHLNTKANTDFISFCLLE